MLYHDPYVPEWAARDDLTLRSSPLSDDLFATTDVAVIVTDHTRFDFERIYRESRVLVDARNATAPVTAGMATEPPRRWIVKS